MKLKIATAITVALISVAFAIFEIMVFTGWVHMDYDCVREGCSRAAMEAMFACMGYVLARVLQFRIGTPEHDIESWLPILNWLPLAVLLYWTITDWSGLVGFVWQATVLFWVAEIVNIAVFPTRK